MIDFAKFKSVDSKHGQLVLKGTSFPLNELFIQLVDNLMPDEIAHENHLPENTVYRFLMELAHAVNVNE